MARSGHSLPQERLGQCRINCCTAMSTLGYVLIRRFNQTDSVAVVHLHPNLMPNCYHLMTSSKHINLSFLQGWLITSAHSAPLASIDSNFIVSETVKLLENNGQTMGSYTGW